MLSQLPRFTAIAFAAAAVIAQTALASGEPKNQWPFTRLVGSRTPQTAVGAAAPQDPAIRGEPKNEAPFTRPATLVIASSRGFDWASGGIGAAATAGIAIAGAGGIALVRKTPRSA